MLIIFFNDTATTEIYTLSLHDALPISLRLPSSRQGRTREGSDRTRQADARCEARRNSTSWMQVRVDTDSSARSEEHTSELQSRQYLVCRLLLEKKKDDTCTLLNSSHAK